VSKDSHLDQVARWSSVRINLIVRFDLIDVRALQSSRTVSAIYVARRRKRKRQARGVEANSMLRARGGLGSNMPLRIELS